MFTETSASVTLFNVFGLLLSWVEKQYVNQDFGLWWFEVGKHENNNLGFKGLDFFFNNIVFILPLMKHLISFQMYVVRIQIRL